ncbi:MAG TPA: Putrescine importer PuuP, partial [Terriglobia bacterium]|nr:Putrescine importer PuuP [Terriglobia bacterium]
IPIMGLVFCAWIWWGLENAAKIIGGVWFFLGFIYLASSTHGFRSPPTTIDMREIQTDSVH